MAVLLSKAYEFFLKMAIHLTLQVMSALRKKKYAYEMKQFCNRSVLKMYCHFVSTAPMQTCVAMVTDNKLCSLSLQSYSSICT